MPETASPLRSSAADERPARFLHALTWASLIIALFMLGRGYFGFVHDNILYLAQALARLEPEIYKGDIYLAWGSQDNFTAFSPVYAWLIANFGLQTANMALVCAALALFLSGSFIFVRAWVPEGSRGLSMLFIVSSNALYGSGFIFKMGEQFATPRPFVEGAVLLAAAMLVSGRKAGALAIVLAGGLLHPLVALSGLLFGWLYLLLEDRRWGWLLALGVLPLAAGFAGVAPFDQLLQTFDSEWLDSLFSGNQHVFVTQWQIYDWSLVAWDLSILFMAVSLSEGRVRQVGRAALVLAGVSLGVTLVGADLLRNVLITNLQIWRGMWIVHWIALAMLPFLLQRMWMERDSRLVAGMALFGFFLRGLPAGLFSSLMSLALFAGRRGTILSAWLQNLALCALGAGAFVHWLVIADRARDRAPDLALEPGSYFAVEALTKPFPLVVLAVAVLIFLIRPGFSRVAALAALALLVVAIAVWDRRPALKRYAETTPLGTHPFSRYVRPDQEVLWYEEPSSPWVLMQRRSYLSSGQAAGQMFNRETAMRLRERRRALNALEFQEGFCQFMNKGNATEDSCQDDVQPLVDACHDAKDLDFIVLQSRRGNVAVAAWTPPVEYAAYRPTYYLYDCKQLTGR